MIKQVNYFREIGKYDLSDETLKNQKYDIGDPSGKPYICQIRTNTKTGSERVILHCLLYAKNEEDAKEKIKYVVEESKADNEKHLKEYIGIDDDHTERLRKAHDFYSDKIIMIEENLYLLEVQEADTTKAFRINWASNDTLI